MLFFYLTLACAKVTEKGYLFSEGEKAFITHTGNSIRLAEKGKMPKKFSISKMNGEYSGEVLIRPIPERENRVADMTRSSPWEWDLYPLRGDGGWNQRVKLSMMPGNVLKLTVSTDSCLEVVEKKMIVGAYCKGDGDDKNQVFRWVPLSHKGGVRRWVMRNARRKPKRGRGRDHDESSKEAEMRDDKDGGDSGYEGDDEDSSIEDDEDFGYNEPFGYGRNSGRGRKFRGDRYGRGNRGVHDPFDSGIDFEDQGQGRRRKSRRHGNLKTAVDEGDEDNYKSEPGEEESSDMYIPRGKGRRSAKLTRKKRASPYGYTGAGEEFHSDHKSHLKSNGLNNPDSTDQEDSNSYDFINYGADNNIFGSRRKRRPCSTAEWFRSHSQTIGEKASAYDKLGCCNPRDPGDSEICRINKTALDFRRAAGISV